MLPDIPDILTWERQPLAKRTDLPALSAVYAALNIQQDSILYIGQTRNLHKRWAQHSHMRRLITVGCTDIAWFPCPEDDLRTQEIACIARWSPTLNARYESPTPRNLTMASLTVTMAAQQLGISQVRVNVLIHEGRLPATRVCHIWFIDPADLDAVRGRPTGWPKGRKRGKREK